jgi:hypothetical protein
MYAVHAMGLAVVLLTCLCVYGVGRILYGDPAASWAALLYAWVSACKAPVDGLAVNGELMLNLPSAAALFVVLTACTHRKFARTALDAAGGALIAVAALYKYQGLALVVALPPIWLRRAARSVPAWFAVADGAAATSIGFASVTFAVVGYFAAHGSLDDALNWAVLFNRRYLADGPDMTSAASRLSMQLVAVVLPGIVLYAGAHRGLRRLIHAPSEWASFVAPWAAATFVCVCLGGRFFGHYFLQLELPLALIAAPVVAEWFRVAPRRISAACALPSMFFFILAATPSWSRTFLNPDDPDYDAIGHSVAALTRPDDTIWVWGNVPQIYYAADRTAGVRFTFCNYLTGLSPAAPSEDDPRVETWGRELPAAWDMVRTDLARHAPRLIVDTAAAGLKSYGKYPALHYPVLRNALNTRYRLVQVVEHVALWQRVD